MTFRVEWLQSARDDLAWIWERADFNERQAITAASSLLDQKLQHDPDSQGESRPEGQRIVFEAPLGVTIRLERVGSAVLITRVRYLRRRK
jgi:hypothetical protein